MSNRMNNISIAAILACGVAIGMIVDNLLDSQKQAEAQAPRPSLTSLQSQIDAIVSGATVVGRAAEAAHSTEADHALLADFADDAMSLDGIPGSGYLHVASAVHWSQIVGIPEGVPLNAGDGLVVAGNTISVAPGFVESKAFDNVIELRAVLDPIYVNE